MARVSVLGGFIAILAASGVLFGGVSASVAQTQRAHEASARVGLRSPTHARHRSRPRSQIRTPRHAHPRHPKQHAAGNSKRPKKSFAANGWKAHPTVPGVNASAPGSPSAAPVTASPPVPIPNPGDAAVQVPFPAGLVPTLVYSNDFFGATLGSEWNIYNGPGNGGFGLRSGSAVSLDGSGDLVITASMQNGVVVSGGLALRMNQVYGRYQVRVRTSPDPSGTTSGVVLTWPGSNQWPIGGEIDMYETLANPQRTSFQSAIHYGAGNSQFVYDEPASAAAWHTITMDWTPAYIATYMDGSLISMTTSPAAIPTDPQHLCIQLDAVNNGMLSEPVQMFVDSVQVWSYSVTG